MKTLKQVADEVGFPFYAKFKSVCGLSEAVIVGDYVNDASYVTSSCLRRESYDVIGAYTLSKNEVLEYEALAEPAVQSEESFIAQHGTGLLDNHKKLWKSHCECGSEKVGGLAHSSWCPKHEAGV